MSIRPLDMQVMVPKTQEISSIKHLEQQKSNINQHNISQTMNANIKNETKNVVKSGQNEKTYHRHDAKKKGKNKYQSSNNKKDGNKEKSEEKANYSNTRKKIDIRI